MISSPPPFFLSRSGPGPQVFLSILFPVDSESLKQGLEHSRSSINTGGTNEWMHKWMKYKQPNGFPLGKLSSSPFWFSEVVWMRWIWEASEGQVGEKMSLSPFQIPSPWICPWADPAGLSPKVAPPPAGKHEELQGSADGLDAFLIIKPGNLERNQVEEAPGFLLWATR